MIKCHTLDFSLLSVTADKIYAEMGYRQKQPEEHVVALTESLLKDIRNITRPECTFKIFPGCIDGESVRLSEGTRLQVGPILSSLMQGSESFALFTATAGSSFQRYQDELKKENDFLKIYTVDIIGSCIAEETGDYMEKLLEKEIGGLLHTSRYSPGYCDWHLSGQRELFRLLGGNPCEITLSNVFLMQPVKSISGIIGIGRNVKEKMYGCYFCELETCYKRISLGGIR